MSADQCVKTTMTRPDSTPPGAWLGLALSAALHGALAAVLWQSEAPRSLQPETHTLAVELMRVGVNLEPSEPTPAPILMPPLAPAPKLAPQIAPNTTSKSAPKPAQPVAKPKSQSKSKSKSKSKPKSTAHAARRRTASSQRTQPSSGSAKPATAPTPANRDRAEPSSPPPEATSAAAQRSAERAYLSALHRAIARHQHYPASARRQGQSGVATVAFTLAADGRISQIRLVQSSGHAALDRSAVQALTRLGRFEPIPAALERRTWSLRIPIRFALE